jgi:hypothetical protein
VKIITVYTSETAPPNTKQKSTCCISPRLPVPSSREKSATRRRLRQKITDLLELELQITAAQERTKRPYVESSDHFSRKRTSCHKQERNTASRRTERSRIPNTSDFEKAHARSLAGSEWGGCGFELARAHRLFMCAILTGNV